MQGNSRRLATEVQAKELDAGIRLSPAQESARDTLRRGLAIGAVSSLQGETGRGKSTVLAEIHREFGGAVLKISDLLNKTGRKHPLALEESFFELVLAALKRHHLVIVDDFEFLQGVVCCSHAYPRMRWIDAASLALCDYANRNGKKIAFSNNGSLPGPFFERAIQAAIARFRIEDYQVLVGNWLGDQARALDFAKIFRFAPKLNAHQLKAACDWVRAEADINTATFIEYLRSRRLTSNVDLEEVQQVSLRDLIGVEEVIRSLEIHIALPLENDKLATEMNLRPKRGVLLYGPPGTGKTTVGRALAHRLKGKFFLIDGTFIAGTGDFFARVHQVFEAAKENSPAVIFIDDADAIFEGGEQQGLYRYLLTMLDGLESESAGRVCVMMTAMDVGNLPLALVRSGRVELWLEMKLPDSGARHIILNQHLACCGGIFVPGEYDAVIAATEKFTGADLKRVVEDAKGLFAFGRATGVETSDPEQYLLQAVQSVTVNKKRYAEAEEGAKAKLAVAPQVDWPFPVGISFRAE
ncbi:MAG: AAA family ATPase [Acidobacteriaceae bacterium]|nr:AAA family ATPase [Acidobacteriaceae bacterium]MBV9766621.1 AAA family ATPase [Acidobacteriaceae bacterium]